MREEINTNQTKNSYKSFYSNYLLLLTLGLIWIVSGIVGIFNIQISILILVSGITLFRPLLVLFGKMSGIRKVYKDDASKLLTKILILGICVGLVAGFFPFTQNINLFFPTFSIVFGTIFGCLAFYSSIRTYSILAVILITGGLYFGYFHPERFSHAAYFSGMTMAAIGIVNGMIGKKIRISLSFNRKRLKDIMISKKIARQV